MVKQLGISAYFLKLSLSYLRSNELPHIINKSKNLNLTDEKIRNLTYQQRTKMLNENPVLVERHCVVNIKCMFSMFSIRKLF